MKRNGFTLIELIITASIIAILAAIGLAFMSQAIRQSHDADRKGDLRTVQGAIELYRQRYGRYPDGCNGPNQWSGQLGTSFECTNSSGIYATYEGTGQYIIGHEAGITFAPEFIPVLPVDAKLNGANSGYVYTVNADGSVFKLVSWRAAEAETVDYENKLRHCDVGTGVGICDSATPTKCLETNPDFMSSYGVWGGFASTDANTAAIICDAP